MSSPFLVMSQFAQLAAVGLHLFPSARAIAIKRPASAIFGISVGSGHDAGKCGGLCSSNQMACLAQNHVRFLPIVHCENPRTIFDLLLQNARFLSRAKLGKPCQDPRLIRMISASPIKVSSLPFEIAASNLKL